MVSSRSTNSSAVKPGPVAGSSSLTSTGANSAARCCRGPSVHWMTILPGPCPALLWVPGRSSRWPLRRRCIFPGQIDVVDLRGGAAGAAGGILPRWSIRSTAAKTRHGHPPPRRGRQPQGDPEDPAALPPPTDCGHLRPRRGAAAAPGRGQHEHRPPAARGESVTGAATPVATAALDRPRATHRDGETRSSAAREGVRPKGFEPLTF